MRLWHIVLAVVLLTPATGCRGVQPSPSTEVMRFEYGQGEGQLDTTRVDTDDPQRHLVQSYRVMDDDSVWLMPRGEVAKSLWHFSADGTLIEEIRLTHAMDDFLVTPGGILMSAIIGRTDISARFEFLSFDGRKSSVSLPKAVDFGKNYLGRLSIACGELLAANPAYNTSLRLGTDALPNTLDSDDIVKGVPTCAGAVWQDTKYIVNDGKVVLDIGLETGGLVAVHADGSFVLQRSSVRCGPAVCGRFETYDPTGHLVLSTVTSGRTRSWYGVGNDDYLFKEDGIYQLVLDRNFGQLIKY